MSVVFEIRQLLYPRRPKVINQQIRSKNNIEKRLFIHFRFTPKTKGKWKWKWLGGGEKENHSVTMTKVKNAPILRLTIKLYNYECGSTDRPKYI